MSSSAFIHLDNITHIYLSKREANLAIEKINLTIDEGEFVSIVGPSGCGKSTILSCIAGLIIPTEGHVYIQNNLIEGPSAKVGYMLQSDYLFEWRNIKGNAKLGLEVMGKLTATNEKYLNYLLHEMGLAEFKHHYPRELSGGMRQRAALVRTLVTNPDILLLDEPFSALDYQTKLQLEDLVFTTLKKHKKTAVLVTHDISEAIAMSDRIVILSRNPGKVKKEILVPEHIRETLPFHAREKAGFHDLFHQIWKELETVEY